MTHILDYNPNTYCVNWLPGHCGAFICLLLNKMIRPDGHRMPYSFDEFGNAHQYWSAQGIFNGHPLTGVEYGGHKFMPWRELFHAEPTCKNIIITTSEEMLYRANGNTVLKSYMVTHRKGENTSDAFWKNMKTVLDVTPDDIVENPKSNLQKVIRLMQQPIETIQFPYSGFVIPRQYTNRIFEIKFRDIIHNPTKVLIQLSIITGVPFNDHILDVYHEYLDSQEELVHAYMPWIKGEEREVDKFPPRFSLSPGAINTQ